MKIPSLIAALVLASTSLAAAQPADLRGEWSSSMRDRDPWSEGRWSRPRAVLLGSHIRFGGDGRAFVPVGVEMGRFRSLQIDGIGGSSLIQQVAIEFEGGRTQVIRNINRMVDDRRPLAIALDGAHRSTIVRVVVYGRPSYPSGPSYRFAAPSLSVTAL